MQKMEAKSTESSEHELILRQHVREEYEKKLRVLEKEMLATIAKYWVPLFVVCCRLMASQCCVLL